MGGWFGEGGDKGIAAAAAQRERCSDRTAAQPTAATVGNAATAATKATAANAAIAVAVARVATASCHSGGSGDGSHRQMLAFDAS